LHTPEGEPIPPNTLAELRRDMVRRRLVSDQIRQVEDARLGRLEQAPSGGPHAMVRLLARVIGIGIETADMLVHEVLSRNLRDRRAIARYAGLTGSPDESGRKRREKGLARSGNGRVRRGMVQLAWRFLIYQKESALAQWFRSSHREGSRYSQANDRGPGAQASDRPVAACAAGRWAGRRRFASGTIKRRTLKAPRKFRPCPYACDGHR
jgi:Transposase IS116/IS110/IS902 family